MDKHVPPAPCTCQCCSHHRQEIAGLLADLDAERSAAATAASESMAMILRLQREKAEVLLDSRQFRLLAEERFEQDRMEMETLEEILWEREQRILSLSHELQACKEMFDDLPKWVNYTCDDVIVMEKRVVGHSPTLLKPTRQFSIDSCATNLDFDKAADYDISDGDSTLDTVHSTPIPKPLSCTDNSVITVSVEEEEIRKLCMRVQALEADRESMKKAIVSIDTDKDQVFLMKDIAKNMYKESAVVPQRNRVVRRGNIIKFFFMSVIKISFQWITSVFFWRKKPSQIKYTIGLSSKDAGLLMLLYVSSSVRNRRFLPLQKNKGNSTISLMPNGFSLDFNARQLVS